MRPRPPAAADAPTPSSAGAPADPLDLLDHLSPGTRRRLVRELARHLRDARSDRETLSRRRSLS